MSEKLNFSIRLDAALKAEVERVATLGGVSPSDVIRVCVSKGLPILAEGYQLIHERFAALRSRPLGTPLVSSAPASGLGAAEAAALRSAAAAVPESAPTPPVAGPSGRASSRRRDGARPASQRPALPGPAPK
jgi:hypothetical protein